MSTTADIMQAETQAAADLAEYMHTYNRTREQAAALLMNACATCIADDAVVGRETGPAYLARYKFFRQIVFGY